MYIYMYTERIYKYDYITESQTNGRAGEITHNPTILGQFY